MSGTLSFSFDVTNPEAVAWARRRSSQLVVEIDREAREALRIIIAEAFTEGIPPAVAARIIRNIIGLTERDSRAVMRRQLALMAEGLSVARAAAKAQAYADTLHRARALTIARTETMAASNEGQQQLWGQAIQANMLPSTATKVWLTADPCIDCGAMESEEVPVMDVFSCGDNPPLHPNCRCTIGIGSA